MTTIYVNKDKLRAGLPARKDFDFYPTPLPVAVDALRRLPTDINPRNILDPGAGTGVWGKAARFVWPRATLTGVDIRPVVRPSQYSFWFNQDFLLTDAHGTFDMVIGNPPYNYAEQFVRHGMAHLESGGYLVFLLRLNFLESQSRAKGLWRHYPPRNVVVCSSRISFTGDGKTNATAYAYFIWQKGWQGETALSWSKAA